LNIDRSEESDGVNRRKRVKRPNEVSEVKRQAVDCTKATRKARLEVQVWSIEGKERKERSDKETFGEVHDGRHGHTCQTGNRG
jgi:hypothetical protein